MKKLLCLIALTVALGACTPATPPAPTTYTLTTTVEGQGQVAPRGGTFDSGATATLSATPANGWEFIRWEGDATGATNPISITMNSDKTVKAVFRQKEVTPPTKYHLTIVVNPPQAGQVTPSPAQPADGYIAGTQVLVTVTANDGYHLVSVEGTTDLTVTMDGDKTVTAVFEVINSGEGEGEGEGEQPPVKRQLTTSVVGSGSVSPANGQFDDGSSVTLTATPAEGWEFTRWEGSITGTTNPVTLTMNGDKTATAVFTEKINIIGDATLHLIVDDSGPHAEFDVCDMAPSEVFHSCGLSEFSDWYSIVKIGVNIAGNTYFANFTGQFPVVIPISGAGLAGGSTSVIAMTANGGTLSAAINNN